MTHPSIKSGSKDINKILRKAVKDGWHISSRKKSGHILCFAPNGIDIVTISLSPRDKTATKKVESDFKRAGLKL